MRADICVYPQNMPKITYECGSNNYTTSLASPQLFLYNLISIALENYFETL